MWTLPVAVALLGATACAAEIGAADGPEAVDEAPSALAREGRPIPPHGGHPGGPEGLLVAALHELDLSEAQRAAIQGALEGLTADTRRAPPPDRAPFLALAAGVRAGKVDEAATIASFEAARPPEGGRRAGVADALRTLHQTLTKEQRRALIDAIAQRVAEHEPPDGAPARRPEGERGERPGAPRGEGRHPGGPLGMLLGDLSLTDSQRDAIDRALEAERPKDGGVARRARFEAHRAERSARLETFASDAFDADAFAAPPAGPDDKGPKEHVERLVHTLAVVVPLLDETQRQALASRLEQGPPPMGHPGQRPGRRGPERAPSL
jgi:Spy/CpxP family protein refolding chaperone